MPSSPDYFFLDGIPLGAGDVALAAQYNAYADMEASRLLLWLQGAWTYVDFDEDVIRSLAYDAASATLYMLGKNGSVYRLGGAGAGAGFTHASIAGSLAEEAVIDPEERGELLRIRVIDGRVLACGLGGQLLERRDGAWQNLGFEAPVGESPDFEDVSLDEQGWPLAVGWGGAAYRFAPAGPQRLDLPSNVIFSTLVADGPGRHLLCGNQGVAFEIIGNIYRDCSVEEPQGNLWSIVRHGGLIYACEPGRLLVRKGQVWEAEVVSQGMVAPSFHRLVSTGTELWSFGADHVFVRREDGQWQQFAVIGNEV